MVGISHPSFKTAIELAHDAERLGAAAVQLLAPLRPFAGPPTQGDLIAYFEAIGRETRLPITLYLNPGPGADVSIPDTIALAKLPQRAAHQGKLARPRARVAADRRDRPRRPRPLFHHHADAARDACSSAAPARPCRRRARRSPRHVIDAFVAKDHERAAEMQLQFALFPSKWMHRGLAPAMKAAMNLIGIPAGDPYPPYSPLSRDELAALAATLEDHRARAALQGRSRLRREQRMAQQAAPPSTPYGAPITIAAAKQAMAAAEAEAAKNSWGVAIAIVDSGANLVMLHRLDNAQLSSVRIAEAKARTAAEFRRPTKVFEDAVAGGGIGLRVLTFGASVAEGGVPIVSGGGDRRRHRRVGRAIAPGRPGRAGRRRRGQIAGELIRRSWPAAAAQPPGEATWACSERLPGKAWDAKAASRLSRLFLAGRVCNAAIASLFDSARQPLQADAEPEQRIPALATPQPHRDTSGPAEISGARPNTCGITSEISLSLSTPHFEKPPIIGELIE